MLYQLGHGQTILSGSKARGASKDSLPADATSIENVCSISKSREYKADAYYPIPDPDPDPGPGLEPRQVFRYYCKDAAEVGEIADVAAKLTALADAMAEASNDEKDEDGESTMPPVMTYFGQFVDHDITANTDREEGDPALSGFNIDRPDINPQSRDEAETVKMNLRKGRLELDSLYGDGPGQSAEAEKLEAAMRDPADTAKMRIGEVTGVSTGGPFFTRPDLPTDNGADLPRVGAALDDGSLTMADAQALFGNSLSDAQLRRKPLIGDGRNEENLIVAQFHLSFLRLHNALVDKLRADNFSNDNDELFKEARKFNTWIYQWLVVNVFLRSICDETVVDQVLADEAPVYTAFFNEHKDSLPEGVLPMPMEFSVAAYRYGHSMVRGDYDYNRSFGRGADGSGNGRAGFNLIFQFTGGGEFDGSSLTLPDNWIIEWDRFVLENPPLSNRVARKIDTRLALPLKSMRNNEPGMSGIMAHLAARNLRRGYVFNLPSAQGMIECLNQKHGIEIAALTTQEIGTGATGAAVTAGGFDTKTPLWFYVLKEAEMKADGNHLGPLGSRIIAETLIGLLATDEKSYIRQGSFNSWTPAQAPQPQGIPLDSLPACLHASGLMADGGGSRTARASTGSKKSETV